ncbi:(+)-neomenthol dehydrogenase-like [Andrographis paniculata]|uniref:(+)-neomenthol dehydrogenase-like n=1 Tax=Andrographis paniculata TaxID=175694 RepID=UPI0021E95009|nr:(+)-neomenthol dehydrogenase-like [Andrographis paniculata]
MAESAGARCAVVTGANKGIGFEICNQLAANGITVILTARDQDKGLQALHKLHHQSDRVLFHQLDVTDSSTISALFDFVNSRFGKLDILVNNAGITGAIVDFDKMKALNPDDILRFNVNWDDIMTQTYDAAAEGVQTNYYGAKRLSEAFIPLLQLSDSPRIVNVSSETGRLKNIPNEWAKKTLIESENLGEDSVDHVLNEFLQDFKDGNLDAKGWPRFLSAYTLSKAAMIAYTRILARKYPAFKINAVCPGYVRTDMNGNTGILSLAEGAESAVRLALLPDDGPSGVFFSRMEVSSFKGDRENRIAVVTGANKGIGFEVCKQLASQGVTVVLTARNQKRGNEAVGKLRELGLSGHVVFHTLDVLDDASAAALADFVKTTFGKLDILVNNAGVGGVSTDVDALKAIGGYRPGLAVNWLEIYGQTYELSQECVQTNYYGTKRLIQAFIPLLILSSSPRIVNVSTSLGKLKFLSHEWARKELGDGQNLTEEKVENVLKQFLEDFKDGRFEEKGWPGLFPAYIISKAAVNALTRIVARKCPDMKVNAVCPGFVKTDFNAYTGLIPVEEGSRYIVKVAVLPETGPSGALFVDNVESSFDG